MLCVFIISPAICAFITPSLYIYFKYFHFCKIITKSFLSLYLLNLLNNLFLINIDSNLKVSRQSFAFASILQTNEQLSNHIFSITRDNSKKILFKMARAQTGTFHLPLSICVAGVYFLLQP